MLNMIKKLKYKQRILKKNQKNKQYIAKEKKNKTETENSQSECKSILDTEEE